MVIIPRPRHRAQQGVILVWVLFTLFVVMGSIFVTATLARTESIRAEFSVTKANAEALSHAAIEAATARIAESLRIGAEPPDQGTFDVAGQMVSYTIERLSPDVDSQNNAGLLMSRAVFGVTGVGTSEDVTSRTRRVVQSSVIPIFQFAIFYENDVEFYNPAPWQIQGRVHTNSNMYIRTGTDLTFDTNYLCAAGGLYGRPTYDTWSMLNGVPAKIRRWVPDPFDSNVAKEYVDLPTIENYDALGIVTTGGMDSDFAGYDWNGDGDFDDASDKLPFLAQAQDLWASSSIAYESESTVRTEVHGVQTLTPPDLGDINMYVAKSGGDFTYDESIGRYVAAPPGTGTHAAGQYMDQAGLVIESYRDGSWKAFDEYGTDISADLSGAITSSSIFNRRQAGDSSDSIQQIEVDVAALALSAHYPANGLIYMGGYHNGDGTGTNVKAFTVKNASELPSGLSVVSPNSVFLQGDYNTVDPKPAAVIADAVNLLSNAWDNTKVRGQLPDATETTYNVSVVAGDNASTTSGMSGGPHNLVRRHEDWRGIPEHLNGSIVCPFRSRFATGKFQVDSDYYIPPDRFWMFDERNNNLNTLPPYTPVTVEVQSTATWIAQP
ncbi:MAG: hypothetical protein GY930_11530 [bacterium]|nr:hypothetical protein [bacterium]